MAEDTQTSLIETMIEARELVQELHGQVQDATRLKRELAEARAQLGRRADEICQQAAREYAVKLEETMTAWANEVRQALKHAEVNVQRRAAELAGLKTPEEFMAELMDGLKSTLLTTLNDRADDIAKQLQKKQPYRRR